MLKYLYTYILAHKYIYICIYIYTGESTCMNSSLLLVTNYLEMKNCLHSGLITPSLLESPVLHHLVDAVAFILRQGDG